MVAVFKKALRDSRRSIFWLSLALGLYGLLIVSFYPSIKAQEEQFEDIMEAYPEEMFAVFYGEKDASQISITEPGSFLQVEYALWMVLILGIIVIWQAFSAFTNAERDGTLDLMLSFPISRRRYLLARAASTALMTLVVLTACYAGLLIASMIWSEFDVTPVQLAAAVYGAFFLLMVVASFTYLVVTLVPSSRKFIGGLMYFLFFGSYLLHGLSALSDSLVRVQPYLLFDYYKAGELIKEGADPAEWLGLAATALVFLGLAYWQVERKELGV